MTATSVRDGGPAYTATTADDIMAKHAKTVEAYRLSCQFCDAVTSVQSDVAKLVASAKRLGMMVVDLPTWGNVIVCAECAIKPVSAFRYEPE